MSNQNLEDVQALQRLYERAAELAPTEEIANAYSSLHQEYVEFEWHARNINADFFTLF